jgi:hypothetical protein
MLFALCLVVPAIAVGAEPSAGASGDAMAGWVPPRVKAEAKDKQEIQAVIRAMDSAARTGDLDAAAALVDFPVTMMTDNSKGEGMGDAWDRERWVEQMRPLYGQGMKDMKITHKPTVFLLSDSLASVGDVATMTQGGKTITSRSSMFLVRRDGKWRVKAMAEGGWGDLMAEKGQGAASAGQGSPSQGTGTGASEPSPGQGTGTGSGALPPAHEPSPGGAAGSSPERTTK